MRKWVRQKSWRLRGTEKRLMEPTLVARLTEEKISGLNRRPAMKLHPTKRNVFPRSISHYEKAPIDQLFTREGHMLLDEWRDGEEGGERRDITGWWEDGERDLWGGLERGWLEDGERFLCGGAQR